MAKQKLKTKSGVKKRFKLTASGKGSKALEDYRSNNLTFLAGVFF